MDMMVLCRCGHPSGLHDQRGCRAGRYRPCDCRRDADGAVCSAIDAARVTPWKSAREGAKMEEREGFEPSEPVKALQFSRLLH
jgi:hypothetical protein